MVRTYITFRVSIGVNILRLADSRHFYCSFHKRTVNMCEFVSSYRLRPECAWYADKLPSISFAFGMCTLYSRTYKMKLYSKCPNFPQTNARSCYARLFALVVTRTKIGAHIVAIRKVEQKVFLMILLLCILHIMFVTNKLLTGSTPSSQIAESPAFRTNFHHFRMYRARCVIFFFRFNLLRSPKIIHQR